jgi:nitroreductase
LDAFVFRFFVFSFFPTMSQISSDQLLSALNWRYATKGFDSEKTIPAFEWETLKEAMRLAPSSFGLQPWHFLAITSPELKAQLRPHAWNQSQVTDCSHFLVLCTRTDIDVPFVDEFMSSTAQQRGIGEETLKGYRDVVVDFVTALTPQERLQWSKMQTYLALQRLMDSAALLGIDSCPLEGFLATQFDQILELPARDLTATVCCALGYRSDSDKSATAAKSRYPTEKVFTEL